MTGIAYLIGAGPGDPGLLTLRGKACIEIADVVIYDYLADESLLQWVKPQAELIYAGKQAGNHALTQTEINELLVRLVGEGNVVARLKGGDPFVFGRGGEEALALVQAGLAFEVVPGVTSAIAAPAYAGIPVTQRAMATSFAVITGHEDPQKNKMGVDWEHIAMGVDTLMFVMGLGNIRDITAQLQRYGRAGDTPAAVVRWGTKPEQQTVVATLATIADEVARQEIKPPGLLIVGEVVGLRKQLNWYEQKPLFGKRIVVTRAQRQAHSMAALFREKGACVLAVPAIATRATENVEEQRETFSRLAEYQWLLLTSVNAVSYFFRSLGEAGYDARALAGIKVMAIGKKTAIALAEKGIQADVIPEKATAEGMLELFSPADVTGVRILIPRALEARELLTETLKEWGAIVDVLPVYQTIPVKTEGQRLAKAISCQKIDAITFTSASTVHNIIGMLKGTGVTLEGIPLIAIGDITAATLRETGWEPTAVATEPTIEALVYETEKVLKEGVSC